MMEKTSVYTKNLTIIEPIAYEIKPNIHGRYNLIRPIYEGNKVLKSKTTNKGILCSKWSEWTLSSWSFFIMYRRITNQ